MNLTKTQIYANYAALYSTISLRMSFVPVLQPMLSATLGGRRSQTASASISAANSVPFQMILLGHNTDFPLDDNDATVFKHLNFRLVRDATSHYYRAIPQAVR
jgi:hypothetical protein